VSVTLGLARCRRGSSVPEPVTLFRLIRASGGGRRAGQRHLTPFANPFGIALSRVWTEWAAKQGVSETIAAAVYLLSENRRAEEVVGKLNPSVDDSL
jgi:hypothetical protein